MIINSNNLIDNNFISELQKKFYSFCKNSPIPLSFKIIKNSIYIHEYIYDEEKYFELKKEIGVKNNINIIKDWLCKYKYPVMKQIIKKEEPYNPVEYMEMIKSEKIKYEEIPFFKKMIKKSILWRIEKVLVKQDIFIVRNLEEDKLYKFKCNMPSLIFLKRIREGIIDPIEAWSIFNKRTQNLGICKEVSKNNEYIE